MREVSEETIRQIIEGNTESLALEFKGTFDFEKDIWARERLIRSILAMSNTGGGGRIVVGVTEKKDKGYDFAGIKDDHLVIFKSKIEDLKSKVESFSSPSVGYEIGIGKYKDKDFILIIVDEFLKTPLICRQNGEYEDSKKKEKRHLELGAIYIRTLKDKPSSVKLTNPVDIQDFLERSTDKQIINLHKRGWRHETEISKKNKVSFQKERSNF